jgi:uncharacterized protein YbjQ (UPF0145 family)
MKQYHYVDESDQSVGPVSAEELKGLHRAGMIKSTTLVTDALHENWRPLYDYQFAEAAPAAAADVTACPACGEKIHAGIFASNALLPPDAVALINEYSPAQATHRCGKCGLGLLAEHQESLRREREDLVRRIQADLASIPILSLQSPLHWDYTVCGLVTAQTTTGTGVFAEFTASFTDIAGAQSKAYNEKIKAGENICKGILRMEALDLGANAVIAADIDYAEVGGGKGMLMVCMTGTAVLLRNPEVLGSSAPESFQRLGALRDRLRHLSQYRADSEA